MNGPAAAIEGDRTDRPTSVRTQVHEVDADRAAGAVADLLDAFGLDRDDEHLTDTPGRVVGMLAELLTPVPFQATTFDNDAGYDELILVRDIPFTSLCAHHLLPFRGPRAHGAQTVTSALSGLVRDDPATRHEFLALAGTTERRSRP